MLVCHFSKKALVCINDPRMRLTTTVYIARSNTGNDCLHIKELISGDKSQL